MTKFKKGTVINVQSKEKSFQWNNGLFVVEKIVDGQFIHCYKLNKDYIKHFTPTCIGINFPKITKTKLKYKI